MELMMNELASESKDAYSILYRHDVVIVFCTYATFVSKKSNNFKFNHVYIK
jgi:hypothetical protein